MPMLTYKPDDGEPQVFDFNPQKWTLGETRAVEKVAGATYTELFESGSSAALHASLWVLLKRQDPSVRFSDLDSVRLDQIEVAPTAEELAEAEAADAEGNDDAAEDEAAPAL